MPAHVPDSRLRKRKAEQVGQYDAVGSNAVAAGYLMIKSIRINNFRCFRKIDIEGLSRVNVAVGPNGSGKTAFLEAIFLASGASPELALRLRTFRGMGTTVEIRATGIQTLWRHLFHDFDQRKSIDIALRSTGMESRSLAVSKGSSEELRLPLRSSGRQGARSITAPIEFTWKDANGNIFRSRPVVSGDKLTFPQAPRSTDVIFMPSQFRLNPEETAQRFSAISRRNAVTDLLAVLKSVYPDIEDVSVENSDGSWEVFAQVARLGERIPIALHSSGASRLIAILLAITAAERGTVLIDELENGFYYKTLPKIWRAILALATEFKCQVFTSTHSNECLQSLTDAISEDAAAFALLNLDNSDGASAITVSPGDVMAAALSSGFEIR